MWSAHSIVLTISRKAHILIVTRKAGKRFTIALENEILVFLQDLFASPNHLAMVELDDGSSFSAELAKAPNSANNKSTSGNTRNSIHLYAMDS